MIYKKFTIDTTIEAIDYISAALYEAGVEGIEIDDGIPLSEEEVEAMHAYMAPGEAAPFGKNALQEGCARVTFYLDDAMPDEELSNMLVDIRKALIEVSGYVNAGTLEITASKTEDEDFLNNWKKYFHPFSVGDVVIKPTWEEADVKDGQLLISIDPGTAFGTGSHETTKLAIEFLRKYLRKGDRVLDVGSGSGILSIVSLLSGASYACGTDLEEDAIRASRENAKENEIEDESFEIIFGNIIDDEEVQSKVGYDYDIAVANILAPVIISLEKQIINHIKDGALLIVSGIIDFKEAEVKEAFACNSMWEYIETAHDGEWVSIVYRKRAT